MRYDYLILIMIILVFQIFYNAIQKNYSFVDLVDWYIEVILGIATQI